MKKNPVAVALAKRRWRGYSKSALVAAMTTLSAARQRKLTSEQRSAIARAAAIARWAKRKSV